MDEAIDGRQGEDDREEQRGDGAGNGRREGAEMDEAIDGGQRRALEGGAKGWCSR